MSLSVAQDSTARCIQQAQQKHKKYYDQKAAPRQYTVGDWVLVKPLKRKPGNSENILNLGMDHTMSLPAMTQASLLSKSIFLKMDRFK